MQRRRAVAVAWVLLTGISSAAVATVTVTQPTLSTITAAGDDYATQQLGNAWDMNDAIDVDTEESAAVSGQGFSGGIFTGTATVLSDNIYPLHMGYASSINQSRGALHPISTSYYRYVTYKLRVSPTTQPQYTRVIGVLDSGSYGATPKPTLVESQYTAPLLNNTWQIFTFDMVTNNDGLYYQWLAFPELTGLRIDPAVTNVGSPWVTRTFNIDWIRLTASATAAQKTSVQFSDSGSASTHTIIAIDGAGTGTSYTLATGVSGTTYQADTSFLPPGQYQIQVKRTDNTASGNSATFRINSPPQIAITAPSAAGDVSKDFATSIVGNAWGPFAAADFQLISNFTNISYTNPVNSFYGRPTTNDPSWFLNLGGHAIDTSIYRSLCLDLEVFGSRSVGAGSVARVFWGNSTSLLTTSQDIILDDNTGDTVVGHYCIPDLAAVPLEANPNGGAWTGTKTQFRIDPDEFTPPSGCSTADACHDVRLDKVTLSPFAQANPGYTFQWTLADADNASDTVIIKLDPNTNPNDGNEVQIHSALTATGSGSYAWPGSKSVNYGTYNVLIVADDGLNRVSQYAGGPLIVGARDGIFRNGFDVP